MFDKKTCIVVRESVKSDLKASVLSRRCFDYYCHVLVALFAEALGDPGAKVPPRVAAAVVRSELAHAPPLDVPLGLAELLLGLPAHLLELLPLEPHPVHLLHGPRSRVLERRRPVLVAVPVRLQTRLVLGLGKERKRERKKERKKEGRKEGRKEGKKERKKQQTNEGTNELMNEWMNE